MKIKLKKKDRNVTRVFVKGEHDFDIVTRSAIRGEQVYELRFSDSTVWTNHTRGALIMTVGDDGDGISFKFAENFDFNAIGYDQMQYLQVMIKYIPKAQKWPKIKFK